MTTGAPPVPRGPLRRQDVKRHQHPRASTRLAWAESLPLLVREARNAQLREKLDRFHDLTLESKQLQARLDVLSADIKQHLLAGDYAETTRVFPHLKLPNRASFPYAPFLQALGPDVTARCAEISTTRVRELIQAGQLTEAQIAPLRHFTPLAPALALQPRAPEGPDA